MVDKISPIDVYRQEKARKRLAKTAQHIADVAKLTGGRIAPEDTLIHEPCVVFTVLQWQRFIQAVISDD
jgi:sugar phosphate isomerase/epimerase